MVSLLLTIGLALAQDPPIAIPFEKYELANGLDVILSEDHSVPFVQVNLWYDVGSKDEVAGRTGFAHLFEHLMFQGSENHNQDYFASLEAIGARVNGTTTFDRTNYFEGVPSEYLPLALWLESDRMGWLLPALDEEKLNNQKEVVRNERRQRYENTPYGEVWVWLFENLYPEGHPYHVPTIGRHEDIEAATLDDVKGFFRKWYVPENATLTICGDFDPAEAKKLVEQYFGAIPRRSAPEPARSATSAQAALEGEVIVRKTDAVPHNKVWVAWITPAMYQPGDADMDIIASLLSDGKDSALYRELVYERRIAQDVEAYQYSARLSGQFIIEATAAEGRTTDELVAAIDEVLGEMRAAPPRDEDVAVAKTNWEARFYDNLQSITAKADQLGAYNTFTGDPGFISKDLARYQQVTPGSVHTAVKTWLPADRRVVLHVTPQAEQN